MFSQWRHAVESLAQPVKPAGSAEGGSAEEAPARPSVDGVRASLSSSTLLAESALNNLRKTLVAQRPASPANATAQVSTSPPEPAATPPPKPRPSTRTTLEDRLRAKFAIGDASNATTPASSSRASPAPVSVADHPLAGPPSRSSTPDLPTVKGPPNPLSPRSTPLPDSPLVSPAPQPFQSLIAHAANISVTSLPAPLELPSSEAGPVTSDPVEESVDKDATQAPEKTAIATHSADSTQDEKSTDAEPQVADTSSVAALGPRTESPGPTAAPADISEAPASENPPGSSEGGATEALPAQTSPEPSQTTVAPPAETSVVPEDIPSPPSDIPDSVPPAEVSVPPSDAPAPPSDTPLPASNGPHETLSPETPTQAEHERPEVVVEVSPTVNQTAEPDRSVPGEEVAATNSDASITNALTPQVITDVDAPLPRRSLEVPSRAGTPGLKDSDRNDVEALQKRLKLVEQRFTDVSTSFKRLQAEKLAADRVLRELTSVESVTEVDGLRDFLQNMTLKNEMAQDEIRRLSGKLTRQEERIEELRDIHRLESKSQSDQIDKLKAQVEEAEKLLKAAQGVTAQIEQESAKRKSDMERLQTELEKANGSAKDEEEKRTKAIALLKTVRQKLVQAEKQRDDALKEVVTTKEAEKLEREKEKAERARLQGEIEKVNVERETAVQGLRAQFDKEVAALRDRHEKELAALRGQFELEAITTKTAHVREMENRRSRISDLEGRVKTLSEEKDELFDQLQLRQAELESSQSALESLQGQNTELQYQLREATERVALLQEEFSDVRREQEIHIQSPSPSAEDVSRLLSAAESNYETKMGDLRRRLLEAERERDEADARWSKKFAERAKEVDELTATIRSSQKTKEEEAEGVQALRTEIESLRAEIGAYQRQITDLHTQLEKAAEAEVSAKAQLAEAGSKTAELQQSVDESKNREAQLRSQNKTLREELRKVQSSVALLEKQRNPGVGYWASRNESTSEIRSPRSSISDLARETPSSRPSTPTAMKSDEEVNFEYLRNVIMQFLEHKEMRPHLVRILSTILHFTPQETRRLISKV